MAKNTQQKTVKPRALKLLITACRKQLKDIAELPGTWKSEQAVHDGVLALHTSCQKLIDRAHRAGVINKEHFEKIGSWKSDIRVTTYLRAKEGKSAPFKEGDCYPSGKIKANAGWKFSKDSNYIQIFNSAVRHIEKSAQSILDGNPPKKMYGRTANNWPQATLEAA